jgi:hypothetical protein
MFVAGYEVVTDVLLKSNIHWNVMPKASVIEWEIILTEDVHAWWEQEIPTF